MQLPDIFREAIFDEIFILILVNPHKNGVVSCLWPSLKIQNHVYLPIIIEDFNEDFGSKDKMGLRNYMSWVVGFQRQLKC